MTHLDNNAKTFIDRIISESNLTYDKLMFHLINKLDSWDKESYNLSMRLFDLDESESIRRIYLCELVSYGNQIVLDYKLKSHSVGLKRVLRYN